MFYAARIVRNNHNWERPSGIAEYGVPVTGQNMCSYNYGLEEWLTNEILQKHQWGYLDCYRASHHKDKDDCDILLFMLCKVNNVSTIFHVGFVCGVKQLNNVDIPNVKATLGEDWLNIPIEQNFSLIEGNHPSIGRTFYENENWNSNEIVIDDPNGFIVNIVYSKLILYERKNWVNLTALDSSLNQKWRRFTRRYKIDTTLADGDIKTILKKYLKNIIQKNPC